MAQKKRYKEVAVEKLRWRLDQTTLPFETTDDVKPLDEIVGQARAVEALKFGIGIRKQGYNVFVTGHAGTGRLSTIKKLLKDISPKDSAPQDLCYVNNFNKPESPILIRLERGKGKSFKEDVNNLVDRLRKEIPRLFESQEYINAKKEIMEAYESKSKGFFKELNEKVKEEGFELVDVQIGQIKRPEVMPLVDGKATPIEQLESMVDKGRFPKEEFDELKAKQAKLREQIDQIFLELRDLQREVQKKLEETDRIMFMETASGYADEVIEKYQNTSISDHIKAVLDDMSENLYIFAPQQQQQFQGLGVFQPESDYFQTYRVNLIVDNSEQEGPPVIVETHPNYRNIFGTIERVVDRSGVWRTDFSKIRVGSLIKANGGYLVFNLLDAILEPGVWPALKRTLRSEQLEIQTFDPFYLFTTSGLKPEPIELDVKVVAIAAPYLYYLLSYYDEDVRKIFKVRADFDTSMDKNEDSIQHIAEFVKMKTEKAKLRPFDRSAVAALVEQAVRMTGRQEKISTSFPTLADLIVEAEYWTQSRGDSFVSDQDVYKAIDSRIYRANMVEEHIQEMIDRGTLLIDAEGEITGQVNGIAVYSLGDYMFGRPNRITASTSMGRAGIINIEREADLAGNTYNKGVLILAGYLRQKYTQDKPLSISASLAFEQSYGGVDGDSASSSEAYALLSSLAEVPLKQYIAVTGSVNQKGEIQSIGAVNQKIEGFFDCCRKKGLNGKQGVMIPASNVKDLMLRKDVIKAVEKGDFHIYPVNTIDQGIELLTDKKAGAQKQDGTYPKGSINYLVDRKLRNLAEGLNKFGKDEEKGAKKKAPAKKSKPQKRK